MLLRSFAVQATWNYRTLTGTGFAFGVLPALRHLYGADAAGLDAAVRRHTTLFNSHPYLATVGIGAIARLEADGAPPELMERFKGAVRGPLGSLGDRLFWLGWRPLCAMLGLGMLLLGAPWWAAVGLFLLAYNLVHLYVRAWGLRAGLRSGISVAADLRSSSLEQGAHVAARAGSLVAGGAVVLACAVGAQHPGSASAVSLAAAAGFLLGARFRPVAWIAVAVVWVGCLGGWIPSLAG